MTRSSSHTQGTRAPSQNVSKFMRKVKFSTENLFLCLSITLYIYVATENDVTLKELTIEQTQHQPVSEYCW